MLIDGAKLNDEVESGGTKENWLTWAYPSRCKSAAVLVDSDCSVNVCTCFTLQLSQRHHVNRCSV